MMNLGFFQNRNCEQLLTLSKIKYLPKDIFVPLYKISSGKICFTAESESKMLIVNNALIKKFFKTNNAFNLLFERIQKNNQNN